MSEPVTFSYAAWLQQVLYRRGDGYYTRRRQRIGRNAESDFYTANCFQPVWATLVIEAAVSLLRERGKRTDQFTFIEIGAEPVQSLLKGKPHPFASSEVQRYGDILAIPDHAVVFANEWLDAQPFHRLIKLDGTWRELGVQIDTEAGLQETLLPEYTADVAQVIPRLPTDCPEGYRIDLPLGAEKQLAQVVQPGWQGVMLLADYGKTWQELTKNCPQGTARAYHKHRQCDDLLARPGEQDITCHVCWDRLEALLRRQGFTAVQTQRQEAFFIQRARAAMTAIFNEHPDSLHPNRRALHELLHPGYLGHAFQVLQACRF